MKKDIDLPLAAEILAFILGCDSSTTASEHANTSLPNLAEKFNFQPKARQGFLEILPFKAKNCLHGIFGIHVAWKVRLHGFRHSRGRHVLTIVDRRTGNVLPASIPIYADRQGRFLMLKEFFTTIATITDLQEQVFIPYGVLSGSPQDREPWLCIFTFIDEQPNFVLSAGEPLDFTELFTDVWALSASTSNKLQNNNNLDQFEEGVVALTSAVINVDGVIKSEEIQVVREFHARLFKSQPAKMRQARQILKKFLAEPPDLEPVLANLAARPIVERQVVIALLLSIASADGELESSELALIDSIRRRLGISDGEFEKMTADFQPEDYPWYKILGLTPGSSWDSIHEAWLKKNREYNPENYQNLPEAFRDFAQREYQRVQKAYQALARKFGKEV